HQPGLLLGIILISFVGLLLGLELGVTLPWRLWKYFTVPLNVIGLCGLVYLNRFVVRMSGLWFLTAGIYCLIGQFKLFGLDWWSAWPVYVIAAGIAVMIDRSPHICSRHGQRNDGEA